MRENPNQIYPFDVDVTTASAPGSGNVTGSVSVGLMIAKCEFLMVQANSACLSINIEFFADAAMLDRVYQATNRDAYTAPYHKDGTPWSLIGTTNLVGGLLYYKITNNTATASTFDITMRGTGRDVNVIAE